MNKLLSFKKITLILATILAVQLGGCATTTSDSVSGVKRSQFMLLPASYITNMSSQAYTQTLNEAQKKQTLNADKTQVERVRKISNRLISQVGVFRKDAAQWKWEVNVEKNDQLNAYCMPGGKIMVYSGLIEKLNATDDELAAVIGHEIAHALREHGRERMSQAYAQEFGLQALAAILTKGTSSAVGNASMQAASMGSQLFFALPNSREQEREADKIGLELAARAAYNP
ncbi:MAG: M48 family metallopeptidase, partial [Methylotenera sp.]